MNMNKNVIPFSWMPASWGLVGKTRELAQAEYELSGYDLKKKLLSIRKDEYSSDEFKIKLLDLDLEYTMISPSQHSRGLLGFIVDEKRRAIAALELDHKEGSVAGLDYEKKMATLKDEPWVNVVKMDFTKKSALEGSFELDWNQHFVDKLTAEGYNGPTPDNIVNQWFMELCRNIAMEEFDGTGDFTADSQANLDAVKRWGEDLVVPLNGRKGYK